MLHVEEIRPFRMTEAPHHRFVTIAFVIGLHVAVIFVFLIALRPQFFPKDDPGPIHSQVIIDPKHVETFDHPPPVTLQPVETTMPKKPVIEIQETLPPTHPIPGIQGPVGPVTPVYNFPVRAIAGTHTIPDYPQIDARLSHEGTVMLRLSIDERGVVTDAAVERSSGYGGLDQAAVSWVKAHWRYYPATHAGDAVASSADVTVTFRLTNRN